MDKWQDDDTRIKLKPVKNDKEAFDRLFGDEADYIQESNLTSNYKFFCRAACDLKRDIKMRKSFVVRHFGKI